MFDLTRFGLSETFSVSAAVPDVVAKCESLEEAATAVARYFYDSFRSKETGARSLALVEGHVTRPFQLLPPALQRAVSSRVVVRESADRLFAVQVCSVGEQACSVGQPPSSDGDAGAEGRHVFALDPADGDHRKAQVALLVETVAATQREQAAVTEAGARFAGQNGYAVAYFDDGGWHWRPASQEASATSRPSVLGLAVRLPDATVLTMLLHAVVPVPTETADALMAVVVGLKLSIASFANRRILASDPEPGPDDVSVFRRLEVLQAENSALRELFRVRQEIALEQSLRLEGALELAERRAAELTASRTALAGSEARESSILETALDAVIIMDAAGRVLAWNPAAERTFGFGREEALGALVSELIVPEELRDKHTAAIKRYLSAGESHILNRRVELTAVRKDGTRLPIELTITAVAGASGGEPSFIGFLRDITDRKTGQLALLESRERFAHVARTLQRSLLPPRLPEMPGVDVGGAYHASRAGSDVGGDFYDVFRVGRGELVLALGDVCGKGPEAAAITAIARHTIRAVTPALRHPAPVLRRLNDTLVGHDIGERFCSVVVVRAVPIVKGLRLSISCGGHPAPVVVRRSGEVERVGVPGTLLGLFPEVRLFEETVQLGHGDMIVAFTDGVTEATRSGEQFGEERMERVLAAAAGESAATAVQRLLDAVLAFGGEQSRDDIAVVALKSVPDR